MSRNDAYVPTISQEATLPQAETREEEEQFTSIVFEGYYSPILSGNNQTVYDLPSSIQVSDYGSTAPKVCDKFPTAGLCLAFKDLVYSVRYKDPVTKVVVQRKILKECSGIIQPGTMSAIMGPTGGGKTSLLDVLADRKDKSHVHGQIFVDGRRRHRKTFMHQSGYVVQDDVVMGTLTVRENLMFSACLRLPQSISMAEKEQRVNEVIKDLGLERVADQLVGDDLVRGISGGERKRVNIGMELITSPRILFLDEPTTGLDASTAFSVLKVLKSLARRGQTIVLSIHQPQAKIFALFDSVTLLSDGHIVYHGPSSNCVPYFASVGYQCGEFNNPADFALDVLTGLEPHQSQIVDIPDVSDSSIESEEKPAGEIFQNLQHLKDAYLASNMAADTKQVIKNEEHDAQDNQDVDEADRSGNFAVPWLSQVYFCSRRAWLNVIRNPATSVGQVCVNIIVGLIAGLIFYRIDQHMELQAVLRDRPGCIFFICVSLQFSNLSAIEIFLKERVIFMHEKTSGYYHTSAYFTSKLLCDMIPVRVIPTIFLGAVVYFMIGFQSVVAASACFLFSAMFSILAIANLSTTLLYVLMMIFSGLLVSINSWPDYTRWLGYTSFCKYSYELLLENEFRGLTFEFPCAQSQHCTGDELLGVQYINISTDPVGVKVGALAIMIVGFFAISYMLLAQLRRK